MRWKKDLMAMGFIFIVTSLCFFPYTMNGYFSLLDDTFFQHYPFLKYLFAHIHQGNLPLWSPEIFLGYPLSSTVETHLFSPLNWPFFFFDAHNAIAIKFVSNFFIMGVFMFLLARHFKIGVTGALMAALVWEFGNHTIVTFLEPYALTTMVWFPLILLCWDKGFKNHSWLWFLQAGFYLGLSFLGGHIQHIYNFLLFLAGHTLLFYTPKLFCKENFWRYFSKIFVFFMIAIGLFAVNLLPTLSIAKESMRAQVKVEDRFWASLEFSELAHVFFRRLNINSSKEKGQKEEEQENDQGSENTTEYVSIGFLAVVLATFVLSKKQGWERKFFALTMFFLILSLGYNFFLSRWIILILPEYNFKEPHRIGLIFCFGMALLAGRGLEILLELKKETKNYIYISLVVMGTVAVIILTIANKSFLSQAANKWQALLGIGSLLFIFIWCCLATKNYLARLFFTGWMLFCFLFPSALVIKSALLETISESKTPLYSNLVKHYDQNGPTRMLVLPQLSEEEVNYALIRDYHTPDGYLSLFPLRLMQIFSCHSKVDVFCYELRNHYLFLDKQKLLNMFNIRYLVSDKTECIKNLSIKKHEVYYEDEKIIILENKKYFPRSFFINQDYIARGEKEAFSRLMSKNFYPKKEVIIEDKTLSPIKNLLPTFIPCQIKSYHNEKVTIRVVAPTHGWVVLLDRFSPGWQCRVNGQITPIYQANYVFRAVKVSKGVSEIVFFYHNRLFLGAIISFCTFCMALGAILFLTIKQVLKLSVV